MMVETRGNILKKDIRDTHAWLVVMHTENMIVTSEGFTCEWFTGTHLLAMLTDDSKECPFLQALESSVQTIGLTSWLRLGEKRPGFRCFHTPFCTLYWQILTSLDGICIHFVR